MSSVVRLGFLILLLSFFRGASASSAEPLPGPPLAPADPGSKSYPYDYSEIDLDCDGRDVTVFQPVTYDGSVKKFPVIVFAHGQALGLGNYEANFVHFARKGVAVIFPMYDKNFFDQDWKRMGQDYEDLTRCALEKFPETLDRSEVIYSGHSKGGYIALAAAGNPHPLVKPKALIVFEPAGYVTDEIKNFDPNLAVTLVWSQSDHIISQASVQQIYDKLHVTNKQLITLKDYSTTEPTLGADHFYPLTRGFLGQNQENPFQYYAVWKLLVGEAQDLQSGNRHTNAYVYGARAADMGVPDLKDAVERSLKAIGELQSPREVSCKRN